MRAMAESRLDIVSEGLDQLGSIVENIREGILDYDAAEDSSGLRWDDIRIKVDLTLQQLSKTLTTLKTACG